MAAVVAVADVTTACWRRGRSAHRRRGVHRGPHERQLLPSVEYPPTGGKRPPARSSTTSALSSFEGG